MYFQVSVCQFPDFLKFKRILVRSEKTEIFKLFKNLKSSIKTLSSNSCLENSYKLREQKFASRLINSNQIAPSLVFSDYGRRNYLYFCT